MNRLDTRLRKLEGGRLLNVAPWVRVIQHDGESADDFKTRISRTGLDGVNVIARSIVGPMEGTQGQGKAATV